ncbi:centromere protein H [Denticeps clupeoides]|uniref:centromere protein H n=1 Tax=Denticeps clupeoides TaxID=299321 RepID=UPI0010A4EE14|nr:centromere protein H [Denticeps clupeoides]
MEGPTPGAIPDGVTTTDLIRMKDGMSNQCFEMAVKLATAKKRLCDAADEVDDIEIHERELEEARIAHCNKTLALNRAEILNAVFEKMTQIDAEADEMRTLSNRNADLCSRIRKLQQESHDLQDQITKMQIKRRETKGHIKEKMLELTELKQMRENKGEVHQHIVDRAESVLEKYQKIATISQNVLRGIILASRVNWIDDPKLRGIAMGLENIPK